MARLSITNIDELSEYPVKALQKIGTDNTVVGLLLNNPSIDMESDEADAVFNENLFDYNYVDGKTQEVKAYICVETEIPRISSRTIKNMAVYVTVVCHKQYMKLNPLVFQGYIGNRRDNLVRYIDLLLNGNDIFGIGGLELKSVNTINAPEGYTARELVYVVPDFHMRKPSSD